MFKFSLLGLVAVILMAAGPSVTHAEEVEVELSDCPRAVQKTLKRESRGGKIVEIERESEDGETIYESEVVIDGHAYEIEIAEDGTLLSKIIEEDDDEDEDEDDDDDDDEEDEEDEEEEAEEASH